MQISYLLNSFSVVMNYQDLADEHKARVICEFADKVSDEVLHRAGYVWPEDFDDTAGRDMWNANEIAVDLEGDVCEDAPLDCFRSLLLPNVPATLTAREHPNEATELLFGKGRVLDWNKKYHRPNRVMSYEEAARFVVFALAEKILQIIRKNEWDQMRRMVDLYDRLAHVWTHKQQGFVFLQIIPDESGDDEESYYEQYVGTIFASNIHEAANITGFQVLAGSTEERIDLESTRHHQRYRLVPAGLHPAIDFKHM